MCFQNNYLLKINNYYKLNIGHRPLNQYGDMNAIHRGIGQVNATSERTVNYVGLGQ